MENTLLHIGFFVFLFKLAYDDLLYQEVNDKIILFGTVYTLFFQLLLGRLLFSISGLIIGFFLGWLFFKASNCLFTIKNAADLPIKKGIGSYIVFPLVPSLAVAYIIHFFTPNGLCSLLIEAAFYIKMHYFWESLILAIILLFFLYKRRTTRFYLFNLSVFSHYKKWGYSSCRIAEYLSLAVN